jgi:hypothetical protein
MGTNIAFWSRFGAATSEEQKTMLRSPEYLSLYQSAFIGSVLLLSLSLGVPNRQKSLSGINKNIKGLNKKHRQGIRSSG